MIKLSKAERDYLRMGAKQPGGKLPLFDENGQLISPQLRNKCVQNGLVEPWFANPIKPDWLVCRLTAQGREAV